MEDYKVIFLKRNSDKLKNFLEENSEEIIKLKNGCWGSYYHFTLPFTDYETKNLDWFIAMDGAKPIAIATTSKEPIYKYNFKIDTYVFIDVAEDERYYKDQKKYLLEPLVHNLCRNKDKQYKGAGRYLLNSICDHYKELDKKYIYLVPESVWFKKFYTGIDCNIRVKEDYLKSQKELIKYYERHDFEIYDDHYDVERCQLGESVFIFFPVMRKEL